MCLCMQSWDILIFRPLHVLCLKWKFKTGTFIRIDNRDYLKKRSATLTDKHIVLLIMYSGRVKTDAFQTLGLSERCTYLRRSLLCFICDFLAPAHHPPKHKERVTQHFHQLCEDGYERVSRGHARIGGESRRSCQSRARCSTRWRWTPTTSRGRQVLMYDATLLCRRCEVIMLVKREIA